MAYDEPRNEVVLFAGGDTNGNVLSDTWVWNGETWKQKFPAHHPSSRYNHGMAYDASRREVVLVGGFGPAITDPQNTDTWVWNGQDWKQRFPAANPGAREVPANLAYDEVTKRIVLFGGAIPLSHFAASDTWEWDGHNWQDKTSGATESGPNGMYGNISLAYDAVNRKVVFLGLNVLNSDVFLATWLWNGSTWQQVFPQHSPPARGQMAADIVHRKVVLFDGDNTSTWNGHDWTLRGPSSSPPFRSQFAISSNPAPCRDRHDNGAALDPEPVEDQ
jgi:hypothetical protein